MLGQWQIGGKSADKRDLIEALALARQHRKRLGDLARERHKAEGDARAVGAALRKIVRQQERKTFPLRCRPPRVAGRRKGTLRSRKFETLAGLTHSRPSYVASDGFSSFHCKVTSRGLGGRRRARDRPYTRGEAVRAIRYILREAAREVADCSVTSNISLDPDEIAGVFAALEELEVTAGAKDANVYLSIVISLPHELEERATLLREICAPFEEEGLPYAAVLHAPDADGDQRNYHAHIVVSLRPFRREEDGSFAFAANTAADLNDVAFITLFREHIAERTNAAMERAGHRRRFTAKSRRDRGLAPANPNNAKSTPGRKHRERRADNIAHARTEQEWLAEHDAARTTLVDLLQEVLGRAPDDRQARIANLEAADERLAIARETAQPKSSSIDETELTDPPAIEPIVTEHPVVAPDLEPVAHAQPDARPDEQIDPAPPISPGRTETPANPGPTSPAEKSEAEKVDGAATPSSGPAKLPASNAARIAREAALARQSTVAPAAGGSRAALPKQSKRPSHAGTPQTKRNVAAAGISLPAPKPRPVRNTVEAFRLSATFRALTGADRSMLDEALQMPMAYIVNDRARLRIEDGVLRVSCTSDAVFASLRRLAATPAGWELLARVAHAKPHPGQSDWGWWPIDPPAELGAGAAQTLLRGSGEGR